MYYAHRISFTFHFSILLTWTRPERRYTIAGKIHDLHTLAAKKKGTHVDTHTRFKKKNIEKC